MDLIGTAVLPIAIALTYTLVVTYCLDPPSSFTEAIPLMLLVAVIGLPAVLILLATRKIVYVAWMGIYLIFVSAAAEPARRAQPDSCPCSCRSGTSSCPSTGEQAGAHTALLPLTPLPLTLLEL
jgi:hypothetical protein